MWPMDVISKLLGGKVQNGTQSNFANKLWQAGKLKKKKKKN